MQHAGVAANAATHEVLLKAAVGADEAQKVQQLLADIPDLSAKQLVTALEFLSGRVE